MLMWTVQDVRQDVRVGFCISHLNASVPMELQACQGILCCVQCWIMSPLCALWGPLLLKCMSNSSSRRHGLLLESHRDVYFHTPLQLCVLKEVLWRKVCCLRHVICIISLLKDLRCRWAWMLPWELNWAGQGKCAKRIEPNILAPHYLKSISDIYTIRAISQVATKLYLTLLLR